MTYKLEPCPFCKGKATLIHETDCFSNPLINIRCCDCRTEKSMYVDVKKSFEQNEAKAIEAWNNRPSLWHTGTPTYRGRYLVSNGYDTSISYFDGKEFIKDFLGFPDVGDIVKWQKIDL